jgi:predicted NAD/FAD-binding protein
MAGEPLSVVGRTRVLKPGERIAIIGTGIAGMGAAWLLKDHAEITLFEKNDYIGGHTNTVLVREGNTMVPIDTGFIVCNYENYPQLMHLFKKLDVALVSTNMGFSAVHERDNIRYKGSGLNGLFAQRSNLFSIRYWQFLRKVQWFNNHAEEVLHDEKLGELSIKDYAAHAGLGEEFLQWYIIPMSSALWSTPVETTLLFPVRSLVRFFKNHGLLGLNTQFQWYTVKGGSSRYKQKLIASYKDRIRMDGISGIKEKGTGIELTTVSGDRLDFDRVIIATHADQALEMLDSPSALQHALLSPFSYQVNHTVLHTDHSVMPKDKKVWSSWNYRVIGKENPRGICTYWMNSLQGISEKVDYFVTLNGADRIDPGKVIRAFDYEHPVFTVEAMKAQERLHELNKQGRVYFCGSYFRNGFHEDAFRSAVEVCALIKEGDAWT